GSDFGSNRWIQSNFNVEYTLCCNRPYFVLDNPRVNKLNFSTNFFSSFLIDVSEKLKHELKDKTLNFFYNEQSPIELINNNRLEAYFYFNYGFNGLENISDFEF